MAFLFEVFELGAYRDLTPALLYHSLTVKLNTADFALLDPLTTYAGRLVQPFDAVRITDPPWSGQVVLSRSSDPVDRPGHVIYSYSAINTTTAIAGTAPFDLSDTPSQTTSHYRLEDGSGKLLEESGTPWFVTGDAYLIEGAHSYGYQGLSVSNQIELIDGTTATTQGQVTIFQPGLWPGMTFALTSANQGYSASPFVVTEVTVRWPVSGTSPQPAFTVMFGLTITDRPLTLRTAVQFIV